MSTPCTTCGEPLDATVDRCPTCGALASPVADEATSLPTGDPTAIDDAPPWSIPIRDPGAPGRTRERQGSGRTAGIALVAVAVLALVVLAGSRLLGDDDSDATSRETAQPDLVATDETGGLDADVVEPETTTTTATTTSAPPTTEAEAPVTTTTAAAPTTTAAPATTTTAFTARTGPNGTGSVPALSTGFRGWLAQLTSVPYSAGTGGLAEEWQRARGDVPGAVAARSDDWSAFRDGFWVLVDPGPFGSAEEVRAFCAAAGFDGETECLPRELRG